MPYNKLLEISKEPQFLFGEKVGSDINRSAKSKQKSKEVFWANDKQTTALSKGPLLGNQQNKGKRQNVKMVLSKSHSQRTWKPGEQLTNINIGQFQGYQDKTLSLKSGTTKQNFLSYP